MDEVEEMQRINEDLSTNVHDQGVSNTAGIQNTAIGEGTVGVGTEEPQELERVDVPSLKSSAAKASFTCGVWTAKKTDKKATQQVENTNNLKNVGEFKKSLMTDNKALKKLNYYNGKARNTHYSMTMACGGNNEYIIPT